MLCSILAKGCEGVIRWMRHREPRLGGEQGALMRVNMVPEPRTEPGERDPGKAATGAPIKASGV